MLEEIATTAQAVVERSAASVVRLGQGRSAACAVVVSDRHLVANAHSIDGDRMTIRAADGRTLEASVVGLDRDGDVAVLEVAEPGPAVAYAESPPAVGSVVFAIGLAANGPRLTAGLVSAIDDPFRGPHGRRIHGSIEHTAPLAPGSSGSALLDTEGRLVGINTSRLGRGFYVALPADESFRERLARLAAGEQVERIRLGIAIAPPWIASRMRAAVGEKGYETVVAGKSVTALEIEYGVWAAGAQRNRCFFYFREGLPYERMPPEEAAFYCDGMNPSPEAQAAYGRLQRLKGCMGCFESQNIPGLLPTGNKGVAGICKIAPVDLNTRASELPENFKQGG